MKGRLLIVGLTALVVVAASAGAYAAVAAGDTQDRAWVDAKPEAVDDPRPFIAEKARDTGAGPLPIPVYSEERLLRNKERCFGLGLDAGFYRYFGFRPDSFERLQTAFPSQALRRTPDGKNVYVMYDTDAGSRLYVFFSEDKNGYMFADGFPILMTDGFPILMKKKLSYRDFAALTVGKSLERVSAIDPVVAAYREVFDAATDAGIEQWTKMGLPPTPLHLLYDGVLKIEYRRDSQLGYAITSLVYAPDFVLEGLDGKNCYHIDEADYVKE